MDTAAVSSAGLPVATQGFVVTDKNTPSASKPDVYMYVPFREIDIGTSESNPKVNPALSELPEDYPRQMHTVTSASISQKPQVFHVGSSTLSAAPLEVSAFHGITSTTFGSGHQMLQPVYPGMVMPTRVPFPPPGMPIAYQKARVFPGLPNKPPHV